MLIHNLHKLQYFYLPRLAGKVKVVKAFKKQYLNFFLNHTNILKVDKIIDSTCYFWVKEDSAIKLDTLK